MFLLAFALLIFRRALGREVIHVGSAHDRKHLLLRANLLSFRWTMLLFHRQVILEFFLHSLQILTKSRVARLLRQDISNNSLLIHLI